MCKLIGAGSALLRVSASPHALSTNIFSCSMNPRSSSLGSNNLCSAHLTHIVPIVVPSPQRTWGGRDFKALQETLAALAADASVIRSQWASISPLQYANPSEPHEWRDWYLSENLVGFSTRVSIRKATFILEAVVPGSFSACMSCAKYPLSCLYRSFCFTFLPPPPFSSSL